VTLATGVEAIGEPERCRVGMQDRGQLGFTTIEENASE
jgi:hypothetical protein